MVGGADLSFCVNSTQALLPAKAPILSACLLTVDCRLSTINPMKLNPLAAELNATLERESPAVLEMLSALGRRYYYPRGILSQSAEAKAKAHRTNATSGIATEGGVPMHLPSVHQHFQGLAPKDLYPYAPVAGKEELRKKWRAKQLEENPRLRGRELGLPIVTSALTHGLSLVAEM